MVNKITQWSVNGKIFDYEEEAILYEAERNLEEALTKNSAYHHNISNLIMELRTKKDSWVAMKEFIGATEHLHAPPPPARIFEVGEVQNAFKEDPEGVLREQPAEHFQITSIGDDTP